MTNLDMLIVGAGTAGEYSAGTARQFTNSVGMIEKGPVGGECIFHACIPTKALVHAARTYKRMKSLTTVISRCSRVSGSFCSLR